MPFEYYIPRPLTTNDTHNFAPTCAGVYGLSNAKEWVFIGLADNIQASILQHMENAGPAGGAGAATGFVFEICSGEMRGIRQNRLILEYAPSGNSGASRRGLSRLGRN
jgi:hypothetical protein